MRTDVRERGKNGGGAWRPLSAVEERHERYVSDEEICEEINRLRRSAELLRAFASVQICKEENAANSLLRIIADAFEEEAERIARDAFCDEEVYEDF